VSFVILGVRIILLNIYETIRKLVTVTRSTSWKNKRQYFWVDFYLF